MKCCKTCRFLHVLPDARGRRVVRSQNAYPCTYTVPVVALPDSITRYHSYAPIGSNRSWMQSDDGKECPVWAPLP